MLTQRKALVLVTLVLLCCALLSTRLTGWLSEPVNTVVETLVYPAGWLASNVGANPPSASSARTEDPLEDQLAEAKRRLEIEDALNIKLLQENVRLRRQIKEFDAIVDMLPFEAIKLVGARVARHNEDTVNPTMKILRGSLHGLKSDDAVVYEADLIGFVTSEIEPVSATVSLITRQDFSIGVQVMPPPEIEAGEGWPYKTRVKSDGEGAFYCTLPRNAAKELRPGDYVRAADTIRESANGFLLGLIEAIEDDPKDPLSLSRVIIKPRVPIGPQRTVTVLTERTD